MDKPEVVRTLREIATLLELQEENPFKARAYESAARSIEGAPGDLEALVASGDLYKIKGIGEGIGKKVAELVQTGRLGYYEDLRANVPIELLGLLRIPGFGPKKARAAWQTLGIDEIDELEQAARDGRLAKLPGFGEKTAQNILEGIEFVRSHGDRHLYSEAWAAAAPIVDALRELKAVQRIKVGGSLRRRRETIKDIDIVVSTGKPRTVMDRFVALGGIERVVAHGETKSSVTLAGGINCDLRCVSDAQYPFALHYFTGSKDHNVAMRRRAQGMGLKMNEYGLFPDGAESSLECADEQAVFAALQLPWIPPELREDTGEIEAAANGELPALIETGDIRGMIHFHTTESDGVCALEDMAREAERLGYAYAGVCDHSQSAAYARGLKPDQVLRQREEIEKVQKKFKKLRLLHGIESDILAEGALDYPESILKTLDFVVISIHSRFGMPKADMTKRMIAAIENPYATILGHPTGRLLLQRDPYELDMDAVLEAAGRARVALEINAHPMRLDLDWRECRKAKALGCRFAICPDAHNTEGIADVPYGVGVARKGWLTREDVLNCLTAEEFVQWKRVEAKPKKRTRK
ncbi:MAG: DNA polymerase/3'-5' exonuclease PolX [Candidatus Sumerlaeota bacterium]|nr:DNA polymerase/3'-5' exonuclease PolX [Candidatus Sumerlaeota bacterium]